MNKNIEQLEIQLKNTQKEIEELDKVIEPYQAKRKELMLISNSISSALNVEKDKETFSKATYVGGILTIDSKTYIIKPNRVEKIICKEHYRGTYSVIVEYKPLESVRKETIEFNELKEASAQFLYQKLLTLLFKKGIQDDKIN